MAKKPKQNRLRGWITLNYTGLVCGLIFFYLSFLPSLLPRPWLFQGLISGISLAAGYGFGLLVSKTIRWMLQKEFPAAYKPLAWKILAVFAFLVFVISLVLGAKWQNQVHQLVGEPPLESMHVFKLTLIALVTAVVLVLIARGIRALYRSIFHFSARFIPRNIGKVIAYAFVGLLFYWLLSGVLFNAFVTVSNNIYRKKDSTTAPGIAQPTSPYRSGSPESLIPWNTLGYQGRSFVARGPNQAQLQSYTGEAPTEQIRTYVGLASASNATERANLAVKELERTNAFNRKVLILATVTGTGWLEPQSVDSLEYMYGGNSAIVAQQYSYLPSWISFLVDKQNATEAGQALYNAVYAKWATLPKESRPKLIAYGLSLGSFGGQAAYTGPSDVAASINGALFMGTPNDTTMWRNVTDNRDKGSPEWQPTYQQGTTVRFAASNEDIQKNQANWQFPRVLYMQHASDPVVWFSFNLLANEPDWLAETRGPDVSPNTHWYPFVTFLQVTVDQFFGVSVPNGHGHNYPNTIVSAWGAVVPPAGWNTDKAAKLQAIINTYSNE